MLHPIEGPDEHGSVYIWIQSKLKGKKGVAKATHRHHGVVNIDYDVDGNIIGIEILEVPRSRPKGVTA